MTMRSRFVLSPVIASCLLVGTTGLAWAEKPEWAGKSGQRDEADARHGQSRRDDRPESNRRDDRRDDRRYEDAQHRDRYERDRRNTSGSALSVTVGAYFGDSQRQAAMDYYQPRFAAGNCPPGLAKKGNGCLPPGQAKKWQRGQPMPAGMVTYPLPPDLQRRMGLPPPGHEFVRVAGDILLIAIGTGMVIDAIEDLGR